MISFKHISNNLKSGTISVILNFIFQILLVPIFLKYWGVKIYGEWIVITAIVAYFSMANVGLNTVTSNKFSILYSQGKYKECNSIWINNLCFILVIMITIFAIEVFIFKVFDMSEILNTDYFSKSEVEIGLICLTFKVFIAMISDLLNVSYRVKQKYSSAIMINNITLIFENLILITCVILSIPINILFVLYCSPRLIELIYKYYNTKILYNIPIKISHIDISEFKGIIKPSLYFMAFPLGNAIILQGFILVINIALGSSYVVMYTTTRTLVNITKSILGLINNSVWPEISLAFGKNDFYGLKKLHRMILLSSLLFSSIITVMLLLFGCDIYQVWTGGTIKIQQDLFYFFILNILTSSIWLSSGVILFATNCHEKYSKYYLLLSFLSLIFGFILLKITGDLFYIPIVLIVMDLVLNKVVLIESFKLTKDNVFIFFKNE